MRTIIIDVRTEKEFLEGSYPGAINLPLGEFSISSYEAYTNNHIALVCFSGNRAGKVKSLLEKEGITNVSIMLNQMFHLSEGPKINRNIWSVDRQFRLAIGLLIGVFLFGNYIINSPYYLGLLLIVFLGLMYSALTDNCYLKALIGIMPWNKKQVEEEHKNLVPALEKLV